MIEGAEPADGQRPILMFDSGIGGLTVLREARVLMPDRRFVYVADDAAFPVWRLGRAGAADAPHRRLFGELLETLPAGDRGDPLQHRLDAGARRFARRLSRRRRSSARCRRSSRRPSARARGWCRCWRRPARSSAHYTRDLIQSLAAKCHVRLVGSQNAGAHGRSLYRGERLVDEEAVRAEIAPCFVEADGKRTDIVVLACTHYPFLANSCARRRRGRSTGWIPPRRSPGARCRCSAPSSQRDLDHGSRTAPSSPRASRISRPAG